MAKIKSPIKEFPGHIITPEWLTATQVNAWLKRLDDRPKEIEDANSAFVAAWARAPLVEFHLEGIKVDDKMLLSLEYPSQLAYWIAEATAPLIKTATNSKN